MLVLLMLLTSRAGPAKSRFISCLIIATNLSISRRSKSPSSPRIVATSSAVSPLNTRITRGN
eukprot:CAMPEP_0204378466 /NCGR_PEP_ID=MMETSP0469-20131031/51805_1 /ASSEMBLY_ACC=CAM_ASM_000384 /TAXON_ID=2969 /ORGANISM="Oxyrrhis marina" /LENGTH=61 /DNA_ID=CAMNT_0051369751 /DNA_START=85 /DNA_END=267 /DNA_ORIENTATION=-